MSNQNSEFNCPTVRELQDYLSGKSTGAGFGSLDEHIASCPRSDFITRMLAEAMQCPTADLEDKFQANAKFNMIRDYRILESIGEGGMGCVYRARKETLYRSGKEKFIPDEHVPQWLDFAPYIGK